MSGTAYEHLLAPGRIGSMELRNRLVMSPMETMYGTPEGLPSDRTVAYFAARAAGGVGLVTVGATGVDPLHPETPGGLHLGTDGSVAAHRRLVDAVHEHGARIQPQIVHAGPDGLGPEMHGVDSLGPSVIPSYLTGRPSTEVTPQQIVEVLDRIKAGVRRAREAGYDGVELHAAHGYMFLGSFLAPQRNRRGDRYRGSSVEGRIRVVLEALAAIRSEVGPDFPVTLRISGYERVAGGRPSYETALVAPLLVEAGVDAFHVSGGVIDRLVTQMVNGASYGEGLNVGAAAAVKEVVDVPVIAVGRLHDPDLAEAVLAEGRADFVALGRPLLADPDLPRKLATGGRVRRCISCENCIDSLEERLATDCAVNPLTGREHELLPLPIARRLHVVVVGGGPGGLDAARRAAAQGHRVTLLENHDELGGRFRHAAIAHPANALFLDWLVAEVAGAEIDVRLDTVAKPHTVAALEPDVVVVANGGMLTMPEDGHDRPHVTTIDDVLRDGPVGAKVCVVGGSLPGVAIAGHLAAAGHRVSLLEPGADLASEVGPKRRAEELDELDRRGVAVHVGTAIEGYTDGGVEFTPQGGRTRELRADTVVVTGWFEANLRLHDAIAAALPDIDVYAVGDCRGYGLVRQATEDAARAAYSWGRATERGRA
ncbi:NADH oxidase [Nocardioides sp. Root1257]|uniref:oxidoreductase n=1 Tax=unclassified Nocardioides TaxID=2615069 RepID=UPI0007014E86|nr:MULTISPECIES: FAD-dependent oxidoreductase [unclassified Nocardioides]KQW47075.1 NADH oxidase [Nocardioides sp. Root1257]KRC43820.1 NADH oxidase [Nocardioides sp. Root224]